MFKKKIRTGYVPPSIPRENNDDLPDVAATIEIGSVQGHIIMGIRSPIGTEKYCLHSMDEVKHQILVSLDRISSTIMSDDKMVKSLLQKWGDKKEGS